MISVLSELRATIRSLLEERLWTVRIIGKNFDDVMRRGAEPVLFHDRADAVEAADAWNMSSSVEMGFAEPAPAEEALRESSELLEATCPGCGDPDAYVGLSDVECPNRKCSFFSEKQEELMKGMKSTDVPSDDELEKSMIPFDKLRNMSSRAAKKLWAAPFSSMNISNARDEFWAGTEKGLLRWDSTKDMWIVADGPNEGYAFFAPADVIDMFGDAPLKALRARGANSYVTRYRWDDGKLSLHPEDGSGVDEVLIWDDRGKKWV